MRPSASRIVLTAAIFICLAQNAHAQGVNTDSTVSYLPIGAGGGETVYVTPGTPGNVGIGLSSPGEMLEVYNSTSGEIASEVWNGGTSAGTQARFELVTGTSNSYVLSLLEDGAGSPYYELSGGAAVTFGSIIFPWLDIAGPVRLGSTNAAPQSSLDDSSNTDAIVLPQGTTAQEPGSPVAGMFRYNTTLNMPEYYNGTTWVQYGQAPVGPIHGKNDACNWPDSLVSCGFTCDPGYCLVDFSGQAQVSGGGSSIFGECILASLTAGQAVEKCY